LASGAPPEREDSLTAIDADVVLTWNDIWELAKKVMGQDHYVTTRFRKAVERWPDDDEKNPDGKLSFAEMRNKCRESDKIRIGHVGGETALLKMSLVDAERKVWKWRRPENKGGIPGNWVPGKRWLEIVESSHGFGSGGA
jgi:hypothetical protein